MHTAGRLILDNEWHYKLPAITKLIPLSDDRTILQSTVALIAVRTHDGLISEFGCKSWPNCLAVIDSDTILLGSHSGKVKIYQLNCSNLSLVEMYNSQKPMINANNYCEDLPLLPNQRFAMASSHDILVGKYCMDRPNVDIFETVKHKFDFIASMKPDEENLLLACLSKECVVWSTETSQIAYRVMTTDDPIAIDFLTSGVFAYGGYGSTTVSFCDIRAKKRVFDYIGCKGTKLTCMNGKSDRLFVGTDKQLSMLDLRHLRNPLTCIPLK